MDFLERDHLIVREKVTQECTYERVYLILSGGVQSSHIVCLFAGSTTSMVILFNHFCLEMERIKNQETRHYKQTPKQYTAAKGCIYWTQHELILQTGGLPGESDSAARLCLEHMFSQNDLGSRLGSAARRDGCGADTETVHHSRHSHLCHRPPPFDIFAERDFPCPEQHRHPPAVRDHPGGVTGVALGAGVYPPSVGPPHGPRSPSVPGTGS